MMRIATKIQFMKLALLTLGGLIAMDENSCFDNVDGPKGSSAPMNQALAHLHETMAEITAECTTGASIKLCNHAPSLL
jgi:hypothetical protein